MLREGQVFPQYGEDGFVHDPQSGFSLFLQERCKRVFFIRHAEGYHNVAERETDMVPKSSILLAENSGDKYWDARLTPKGEEQCARLKQSIRGETVWGFSKPLNLDLVVVSPLTRCLQTATLSLGAANSQDAPPFVANELCRERIADFTCDGRRKISELKEEFPGVDFSLCKTDEDRQFYEEKEDDTKCAARAVQFLKWLCGRPEIHIAVVCHSVFLKNLFKQFGSNLSDAQREAIHKFPANAEMRSIMLCAHHQFPNTGNDEAEGENPRTKRQKTLWNGSA
eukprot:TRINITY_DN66143_c0_g1_i1.p1 TRINITY_DN66143_c0_g1~~TRINITY_DN66143_c0_g1_i1.p1  ORF type:complete len:312 (-),score=62.81 TRINITY_DN66143_c0_g1_i1:282-1127(-)